MKINPNVYLLQERSTRITFYFPSSSPLDRFMVGNQRGVGHGEELVFQGNEHREIWIWKINAPDTMFFSFFMKHHFKGVFIDEVFIIDGDTIKQIN